MPRKRKIPPCPSCGKWDMKPNPPCPHKFHNEALERRIAKLKKEGDRLREKLGIPPKYELNFMLFQRIEGRYIPISASEYAEKKHI